MLKVSFYPAHLATHLILLVFASFRVPSGKAPHFLQKPTIKQQANLLVMTCNLESKPDPQIKWFRETQELKDGGRYIIKLEKDAKTPDGFVATLQIKVGLQIFFYSNRGKYLEPVLSHNLTRSLGNHGRLGNNNSIHVFPIIFSKGNNVNPFALRSA